MQDAIRNLLDDKAFKDYAALTKKRNFNAFDVLRYSDYEIRHSNVLAWLLTPGATHGVRDAFVKKFVKCLPSKEHCGKLADLKRKSSFAHDDVRVEREVDYVDIKVFFEKEPRLLLVVENKPCPFLPEYAEQLRRYVGAAREARRQVLRSRRSADRFTRGRPAARGLPSSELARDPEPRGVASQRM